MSEKSILVLNSGSSSLKFCLMNDATEQVLLSGNAEQLGQGGSKMGYQVDGGEKITVPLPGAGHREAMEAILKVLGDRRVDAVGHRIVHGGQAFTDSTLVSPEVITALEACIPLAPYHLPAHLTVISLAVQAFPDLPQVLVFDTAFHRTMPPRAFHYAIPHDLYEQHHIRKYGFHGSSHRYVSRKAAEMLGKKPEELHLLTAHLGNGSSVCAVREGLSVDTSMGFTPSEGLAMGTRSGDVDVNVHLFLAENLGLSLKEITQIFNHRSGMLGISGLSSDMRTLRDAAAEGHERAELAIQVFCYRLARHLLAAAAGLDRVDALIFTGGIGENAGPIREITLGHLKILRPVLDSAMNQENGRTSGGRITTPDSGLLALVVPTNEELVIAREAARFLA
jgi:acetate kinase